MQQVSAELKEIVNRFGHQSLETLSEATKMLIKGFEVYIIRHSIAAPIAKLAASLAKDVLVEMGASDALQKVVSRVAEKELSTSMKKFLRQFQKVLVELDDIKSACEQIKRDIKAQLQKQPALTNEARMGASICQGIKASVHTGRIIIGQALSIMRRLGALFITCSGLARDFYHVYPAQLTSGEKKPLSMSQVIVKEVGKEIFLSTEFKNALIKVVHRRLLKETKDVRQHTKRFIQDLEKVRLSQERLFQKAGRFLSSTNSGRDLQMHLEGF